MPVKSPKWRLVLLVLGLWAAIIIPYGIVYFSTPGDKVFAGFLLNPMDGNTYLAKMYQGQMGEWRFHLLYTADVGEGHYLYVFYLFLGHLARWIGAPLILIYHAARLISAALMVLSLDALLRSILHDRLSVIYASILLLFGSGLGWLFLASGAITPDFWVAEIYPFLSAYVNPHFPLSLALMAWLLNPDMVTRRGIGFGFLKAFAGLVLTNLAPFGGVIVGFVWSGSLILDWIMHSSKGQLRDRIGHLAWFTSGAAPMAVYILWVMRTDPLLAGWNAQNITATPSLGQVIAALSPALLATIPGAVYALKRDGSISCHLFVWAILGLVVIYLPVGIQRRFMLGLFIPLAILAVTGMRSVIKVESRWRAVMIIIILLSLPTNLVVLLAGLRGGATQERMLFISKNEAAALDWLASETPPDALVMASPEMGLFIPSYSGRRVVYGHPYETVRATEMESAATTFYQTGGKLPQQLASLDVDYIFWGPREQLLGSLLAQPNLRQVYQSGDVIIYAWDWVR